jgi:hypothetical protein
MTWFDETLRARERARLEREALAASVEELGSQPLLDIDAWDEEDLPPVEDEPFPPLHLRLQSRPAGSNGLTASIPTVEKPAATHPGHAPRVTSQGQRLAGRTTRVRLQAVRSTSTAELSTDQHLPAMDMPGQTRPVSTPGSSRAMGQEQERSAASPTGYIHSGARPWPRLPGGRGLIRAGQGAITVPNANITERSVVHVMLAGNPGPAVVHYILLHPHMGFTIHLTSPATANAPFHYSIWPF